MILNAWRKLWNNHNTKKYLVNLNMNSPSAKTTKQKRQQHSKPHARDQSNTKHRQNRRFCNKDANKLTWPSADHKCVIVYHNSDEISIEEIKKIAEEFATVVNYERYYSARNIMSVFEMQTSEAAKHVYENLSKSRIPSVLNVAPDNKNKEILRYDDHWDIESLRKGLEDGTLLQGKIRVPPRMYHVSYISDGNNPDIMMDSIKARNRALPGDSVAVKLRPRDQWINEKKKHDQKLSEEIGNLRIDGDSHSAEHLDEDGLRKTGDVVGILEKHHSRICVGTLNGLQNNCALFSPIDSCLPRLLITRQPNLENFFKRPRDFHDKLYVAKISNWEKRVAYGELGDFIGESGDIEAETTRILVENGIDYSEFSQTINDSLPSELPWKIPVEEFQKRKDLRSECIFTIDPSSARDLDDALHCKKIDDNLFEVGVHIADVSYFVKPKSEVDRLASQRCTTVYLVQKVVPMLPRLLCEELCSLNPGQDRLTYSVIWKITSEGKIVDQWFGRTIIHSCIKLSYDDAQSFIDFPDEEDLDETKYPELHGNYRMPVIRDTVLNLFKISQNLRKQRYENGALKLDQIRLAFDLDETSKVPNSCFTYNYKSSNELVEEFMLLANISVAHKLLQSLPQLAFLRCHPTPKDDMLKTIGEFCKSNGVNLDITSSKDIASSLRQAASTDDDLDHARLQGLQMLLIKPQELALYFCTGTVEDQEKYRHYALNVPLYTHFTSPIRRYADIIVHRQLSASLGDDQDMLEADLAAKDLQKQADACNNRKSASKKAQELSVQLFFHALLKVAGSLESDSIVLNVFDHCFDIMPLKYGQIYRVYLDNLPLVGWKLTKNDTEMELIWPCDGTDRYKLTDKEMRQSKESKLKLPQYTETVKQTIKFLSVVKGVFEIGNQPQQIRAFIRRVDPSTN